ncbi:MAG: hypothetical protein JWN44_2198 [Myxococcales bacterium]|nr:hypothetical protein [Myxococcales bacterium]
MHPLDFVLILAACSVAFVSKRVIQWLDRNEKRRARIVTAMPFVQISDAVAGARVKIAGTIERTDPGRGAAFVVRDGSGLAVIYGGSARALAESAGDPRALSVGQAVVVIGVGRAPEPRVDGRLAEGARLVFAGGEAQPLFVGKAS